MLYRLHKKNRSDGRVFHYGSTCGGIFGAIPPLGETHYGVPKPTSGCKLVITMQLVCLICNIESAITFTIPEKKGKLKI